MEDSGLNVLYSDRCDNLRWKGMFVDSEETPGSGDHIFWCLKTQLGLGPDGQLVGKYECNPGRGCYKPL